MSRPSTIPEAGRSLTPEEYASLRAESERTIESSHLFKSLDEAGRERVLQSGYVLSLAAGAQLTKQGEVGDAMYLILRGTVRVETDTDSGHLILAELGPSACVGEVSLLTNSPRTATVTAVTDIDVVAFERHRISRVLDEYPKVRKVLETLIEGRARDMVEKFVGG